MFREDLIRNLEEVSLGMRKARTRVFERNGLRAGQARVLAALFEYGELSQTDIGKLLDISGPTVNKQVQNLVTAGLVELTESGSDKRLNIVSLTAAGRKNESVIRSCNDELGRIVSEGLTEPEIIMTGMLLATISENLKSDQENE